MEVHHHPKVEKKNFKEYFLEFLMIFLAVTMGFFAEQIRESFVEHNHEKEYIQSFYEDLSQDQKNLPALSDWIQTDINVCDSLKLRLKNVTIKTKANDIYVDFRFLIRQLGIKNFVTHRTILQLQNAGEMRLIRNKQVTDSILEYYKNVETIGALQDYSLMQKGKLRDLYAPLLKSDDWDKVTAKNSDDIIHPRDNLYLKSVDPDVINNCLLEISDIKGIHKGFKNEVIDLRNEGMRLKKLIDQRYRVNQ
jgi:hypothetical protein